MKRCFTVIFIWAILMVSALGGCNSPISSASTPTPLNPQIDQKGAHIRGIVTSLELREDQISSMVVEGEIEADTSYAKAFVGMSGETKVFIEDNGEYRVGNLQDLAIGQMVEVLFTGAIATSDPVQAAAEEIIIKIVSSR